MENAKKVIIEGYGDKIREAIKSDEKIIEEFLKLATESMIATITFDKEGIEARTKDAVKLQKRMIKAFVENYGFFDGIELLIIMSWETNAFGERIQIFEVALEEFLREYFNEEKARIVLEHQ